MSIAGYTIGLRGFRLALVGLVLLYGSAIANSAIADSGARMERLACLTGLKAAAEKIENEQPSVSSDFLTGLYGWVMFLASASEPSYPNYGTAEATSVADVRHCVAAGLDPQQVDLVFKLSQRFLPPDPYISLARCFAAFIAFSPVIDKAVGKERGYQIGELLGLDIGRAAGFLRYSHGTEDGLGPLTQAARNQLMPMENWNVDKRQSQLMNYAKGCGHFGVPLLATMKTVQVFSVRDQ